VSEQKIDKEKRKEIVLAALYLFAEQGREKEVSRSELVDCIKEFQKEFPLGYESGEKVPYYSQELFDDLSNLWLQEGCIKQYKYGRRDVSLFPKNFVALKPLGRGRAKKIIEALSPEIIEGLNRAIAIAIKNYQERWGASAR
jgi:hypothetical protein